MNILGIGFGHDAAASITVDGEIIADVAEERFTRCKRDSSFPLNAINYCLNTAGIKSEELDAIAVPSLSIPNVFFVFFDVPEKFEQYTHKAIAEDRNEGYIKTECQNMSGRKGHESIPELPLCMKPWKLSAHCQIHLVEHHLSHAASAAYTSGINDGNAIAVTLDGNGNKISTAIWSFDGQKLRPLVKYGGNSSFGWFYGIATEAMQWRWGWDEWKLMGLAPYGTASPGSLDGFHPVFKKGSLHQGHRYGKFGRWNDHGAIHHHGRDSLGLEKIVEELGRENFAAEVQRVAEEQVLELILPWLKQRNSRTLLCAGGFFLNIKINQRLWESGLLDQHWVYPNAGDAGLPVGCCLQVSQYISPHKHEKLRSLYRGPEFSDETIETILKNRGLDYEFLEDPAEMAAQYLASNYVVAWFQGRMEAGPRALGNRSIVMSPLKKENKDLINSKVKYREGFRPFCPSILAEKYDVYLENCRDEEFMACSFSVKADKREVIPAVVHCDGTARPQKVYKDVNPLYHRLIDNFGRLTGEYVVLNTSFNIKGEPIVCNPREAIKCFYDTGIDVLVLGPYILKKSHVQLLG